MRKLVIGTLISAVILCGTIVPVFASAEHVLVFGHVQPTDHPYHLMAEKFKEELESLSGGRVAVEIHPGGSLGNERDLVEGLKLGTVDVSTITSALTATFVPEFGVFSLPFLFESFEQMYKVMDSPIGEEFAANLEREGLIKLGFNSGGARSMYASKPVNTLDDLQKMKIRTMEDHIYVETWNNLGALATPLPWGDVYTALDTGMVDGAEGAMISYKSMGFYDPAPYVTVINYIFSWHNFMMSKAALDKLPADLQEMVLTAGKRAQDFQRALVVEEEKSLLEVLEKEHGCKIIYPKDLETWRKKAMPVYEKRAAEVGGMELIEKIQKAGQ
ncbi:tripartite ATP-independent transporter DctP family solute receptor [Aminivibrio pyruvatiphilus]|jgi:tripartite ATP-independent transporter DctP family solute receptor|uniref:Tripartite ATP-independent transporter DctP family solute receptor n=1 Tax=Aminivibrio pyruvatiphilus TaxID=1005740 RepID=A0A4V3HFG9_9BACT|nr:TRAP transporter substrate-binding protein [Aminivibrio pyruvatiphilus]TDY53048.1 tripartite ATP-independent transporter DctP family solute receptor [Aminivibrio pyruvatiphilus]